MYVNELGERRLLRARQNCGVLGVSGDWLSKHQFLNNDSAPWNQFTSLLLEVNAYEKMMGYMHEFLTPASGRVKRPDFRSVRYIPGDRALTTSSKRQGRLQRSQGQFTEYKTLAPLYELEP
jgi:hypothetical protein